MGLADLALQRRVETLTREAMDREAQT